MYFSPSTKAIMKFWPFPLYCSYSQNKRLTQCFLDFAACNDLSLVNYDHYNVVVKCLLGTLEFWITNKYYAWASNGMLTLADKSVAPIKWKDVMPSRYAMMKMRKAIKPLLAKGKVDEEFNDFPYPFKEQ